MTRSGRWLPFACIASLVPAVAGCVVSDDNYSNQPRTRLLAFRLTEN